MSRNLELTPRIEEQRNKNEVKFRVVEFDLNEIKSHFDENILNIENNFEIVNKMISIDEIEKSKNIMRSQIVFLESAFDFYLHELSKCGIVKIFNGNWPKTERYNNLKVEMKFIDDAIKNPESYEWLLDYINEKIKREVYISLESMKDQLNLLGIKFEDVINIAFNNKFTPEGNPLNGKQIIQELFIRRNEIAHQSDRNHFNAEQNDITKEYVSNCIENIKSIVSVIHDIAVAKKNE